MRHIGTVLAGIGAVGCWYFVAAYWATTGGDWHRTPAGRHIMQFTGNLGVLFTLIVAARLWPDYPGRDVVSNLAFAALVVQIWWRVVLMHQAQHERTGVRRR